MINEKDYFWKIVAKGDNYTNVVKLNAKTLEGRVVPSDVVETYVPIMIGDKFIGAFEIYYDITTRKGKVDELLNRSVTAVFAITSCLLIAIITILFKGFDHGIITMHGGGCHCDDVNFAQPFQVCVRVDIKLEPGIHVGIIETQHFCDF